MVFNVGKLGRRLARSVEKVAQGVADHLEHSVVAPPAPILLGAAAICLGAAVLKHLRNRRTRSQRKAASTTEVWLLSAC